MIRSKMDSKMDSTMDSKMDSMKGTMVSRTQLPQQRTVDRRQSHEGLVRAAAR